MGNIKSESISITDWNDAYANRDYIPDAQSFIDKWDIEASNFRKTWGAGAGRGELDLAYGEADRERFDLFHPAGETKGLFVFVHGGYWMAFDKNSWSHMARGALNQGWAVAIPSYTLCPDIRISGITKQIGNAIEAAAKKISGPLVLAGHSAGGHLVSRMGCKDAPLSNNAVARIKRIISISGVHDLRPLMRLELNNTLKIDKQEAVNESPALLEPRECIAIDCVVGGNERPEFIRQNTLLANIWVGMGASTREVIVPNKHHFTVIEELSEDENGWFSRALK